MMTWSSSRNAVINCATLRQALIVPSPCERNTPEQFRRRNSPEVFHNVQLVVDPIWTACDVDPFQRDPNLAIGCFAALRISLFAVHIVPIEIAFQSRQRIILLRVLL